MNHSKTWVMERVIKKNRNVFQFLTCEEKDFSVSSTSGRTRRKSSRQVEGSKSKIFSREILSKGLDISPAAVQSDEQYYDDHNPHFVWRKRGVLGEGRGVGL